MFTVVRSVVLRSYPMKTNLATTCSRGTTPGRVWTVRGRTWWGYTDDKVETVKNYSLADMDIGKKGPCMVSGHPRYHVLSLECWSTMRRYIFDHTWDQFLRKVDEKS